MNILKPFAAGTYVSAANALFIKVMLRSELVAKLADKHSHLQASDLEKAVNVILEEITTALEQGDRVELRGFGAFSVLQGGQGTARPGEQRVRSGSALIPVDCR